MSGDKLLTAEEVAAMLAVKPTYVYELSRRGEIPTVTLGRYRRYRVEAIQEWIEQRETSRPPRPLARPQGTNHQKGDPTDG